MAGSRSRRAIADGSQRQDLLRRLPLVGTLPDRALWRVTSYSTDLGQRLGIDWLTYSPLQLLAYHRLAAPDAGPLIRAFRRVFPGARTLADVGAGSGVYAAEARRSGLEVVACERAWSGRTMALLQGVRSRPFELTRRPPCDFEGPVDLAYSIEVAEHVAPELGDELVRYLLTLAPLVVFTAASPGQGGLGHVNEQPREYWVERFEGYGGRHDPERSRRLADALVAEGVRARWLSDNAMVFARS